MFIRDNRIYTVALRDSVPSGTPLNSYSFLGAGAKFSEAIDVGTFSEAIAFAFIGAAPAGTLDIKMQYGVLQTDGSIKWVDSGDAFTQITTTPGLFFKKLTANFGKYIRFVFTGGGSTSYVLTFQLVLKA